jgi:hypothetical protein
MRQLLTNPDDFCFVLTLRHKAGTSKIAKALKLPAFASTTIFETLFQPADSTHWYGLVAHGSRDGEYDSALHSVLELVTSHQARLRKFVASGGELEITAHHIAAVETATDFKSGRQYHAKYKMCELSLYPAMLSALAKANVDLRLCVWA